MAGRFKIAAGKNGFERLCRILEAILLCCSLLLPDSRPARAAVADFCWCGFMVAPAATESRGDKPGKGDLQPALSQVYQRHLTEYEARDYGVIHKLLKKLEWDEMRYLGYVALPRNADGAYPEELENLSTTYGLFLAIEQVLNFAPDVSLVQGRPVRHYTSYIFGSLNLFHLESRRLISSRPFFVIDDGLKPPDNAKMLDRALTVFARRLNDDSNPFTRTMLKQWQKFFGPPGEQRDVVREAEGELANTFGVAPLCEKCVRIKGGVLDKASERELKTFLRYYLNDRIAAFRPVVFLPGLRGQVLESIHTLVTATKEGDVTYTDTCLSGYDESGQTRLCIKFAPPRNLVKLGVRCLVENGPEKEDYTHLRTWNTVLDIAIFFASCKKPAVRSLSNVYQQLLGPHRQPSPLYYFNSLINAAGRLDENTLARP